MLGHAGDPAMSDWYQLSEVLPPEGVTVRVYNHTRGFMNDVMVNGKFSHTVVRWRYI